MITHCIPLHAPPPALRTFKAMQKPSSRNHLFLVLAVVVASFNLSPIQAQVAQQTMAASATGSLPARLSDAEFWKLVGDISEPGGCFSMADNFVSNERDIGTIAGTIRAGGPTGGVYMGVGPEQNFTYIAAVRPRMVFIVDIRRQAVVHHLMYKAIFELSADRADFVSLLFAKPRPAGLDTASTIQQIWAAFDAVATDTAAFARNLIRVRDHLTRTHGFAMTDEELATLNHVYSSFVEFGPYITTSGPNRGGGFVATGTLAALAGRVAGVQIRAGNSCASSGNSGIAVVRGAAAAALYGRAAGAPPPTPPTPPTAATPPASPTPQWTSTTVGMANFVSLTSVTDAAGQFNSFLGNEESFRFIRDLHMKNLFVPNSGDFGGPKAIRAVGSYIREHGATISAFYVSNVESYLFGDGIAGAFYDNVATIPVDEKSVFIRPGGIRTQTALCPIAPFIRAALAGRVINNASANQCVQ